MPDDQDRPHAAGLRPWTPPGVPPELLAEPGRLSYLVVDEVVGDTVTLAVAPWPGSDEQGRVRFPPADGSPTGHLLARLGDADIEDLLRWGRVICDTAMRRWVLGPPTTPTAPGAASGAASGPP